MEVDLSVKERIDRLVSADPIVLFMKGRRGAPQCGFSAKVTQILDQLVPVYRTYDVLSEGNLRDDVKTYSSWPTIPQLYVNGEFIGGCDIVVEMAENGELERALGLEPVGEVHPSITISDKAADAFRELSMNTPGRELHLVIDARFQSGLYFGPSENSEVRVENNTVSISMSRQTAYRAQGLSIDAEPTANGPAFNIDNPNAPRVTEMSVQELKSRLDSKEGVLLFDVRSEEERETAQIGAARLLDSQATEFIETLDRETPIIFHCHHGGRSMATAERYAAEGFKNVYNLSGGIDAWSIEVDSSIPRY